MKNMIFAAIMVLSATAQADMSKMAFVALTCQSATGVEVALKSKSTGAELYVNGQLVQTSGQLSAGTEGGPPYMQFVEGGYNLTLEGDDMTRAFNSGAQVTGSVSGSLWSANMNDTFKVQCSGLMVFQ
jgi:hypothetical protein